MADGTGRADGLAVDERRDPTRNRRRTGRGYNRTTSRSTPAAPTRAAAPRSPAHGHDSPRPSTERAHKAAKRYIYAWGDGTAEGDGEMKDLLGGKGAGLAEMTNAGLPDPARLHDHDRGVQRLLRRRRAAARRALGRRPRGDAARSSGGPARASATPANPLLVSVRSGAKFSMPGMMDTVLNLGPQRGDAAGPHRAHGQRAVRLGRLPALHPDVRPDRHGREGRAVRPRPRGAQGDARREARTRTSPSTTSRRSSTSSRRSSARTPAATSRPTRTSSWTSRSRPSSRAGSASAPATTASSTRSPTTSARPSTS